jgi:phage terminase small subunit
MIKLPPRQERFCREYIKDLNATEAAIRSGYTKKSASVTACKMLRNANMQTRIAELVKPQMEEANTTVERILKEIARLAMVDIGQAFNADGTLKPLKDMPEDVRRCISGIDVDEIKITDLTGNNKVTGLTKKIRFWDKVKTLELLGRYQKLFTDKIEHSGAIKTDSSPIDVKAIINDPIKAAAAVQLIATLTTGTVDTGRAGVDSQQ